MKAALQIATSLLALGGLLASVASHATDVSELPLKAAVVAKPNVIFGMDDSGSMDWEILLDTPSGVMYYDVIGGTGTAWNSTTNKPRTDSAISGSYEYLFPMGTGTGGQIYATNGTNGNVAPPLTVFAWARSFRFNPLYYNPSITYKPWSPAYVNGALKTYANASPTAAKSHPEVANVQTLDLTKNWDSTNANFTQDSFSFVVREGMVVPTGASAYTNNSITSVCPSRNAARNTLTADLTVPTSRACLASYVYYPATYWQPTVCPTGAANCKPAPDCTINTTDCVASPDGNGKLRRYEVKSTNTSYPTGRTYADEIQNFANWFQYHRKRKLMLAGSMGQVLENINGLRLGVVPFNNLGTVSMYDSDSNTASANRLAVAGQFYLNAMVSNGTPTLATINHIGTQYNTDTNIIKYACQRNSTFIVTDGFANDNGFTTPAYTASTWGSGAPYATTFDKTQASLALAYYTNRLRAGPTNALTAGLVPTSSSSDPAADKNPDLHVNFYAISLGVTGSQYQPGRNPYTSTPTWTAPVNDDPSMIDDLWHATINGRGKMYLATTPSETAASIEEGLYDILNFTGAQSGVAVSSVNLARGDGFAYMARYNPARWTGDLTANAIDSSNGAISTTATWSAATLLDKRTWTTRQIASSNGTSGVTFTETGVGATVNPGGTWGTTAEVMNYLRGDRSNEGSKFRTRNSLMGAVINAEPAVDRENNVVYVASGEGMLHAFDAASGSNRGQELWAFVPYGVLPDIGQTSGRHYAFRTQLDGTPVIGKTGTSSKLLVAGLGAAGKQFYALDVSKPRENTEASLGWVKWTFPTDTSTQAKVGQALGRPLIVNTKDGYRVLVTSGYNSTADGKGRLFVLDPANGTVKKEFVTAAGTLAAEAGLAQVAGFMESNGITRYVYGGDLLGNLYRFDLDAATGTAPTVVATLTGPTGSAQPVTAMPELTTIAGKRVILVGTGRLLDVTDWGSSAVQTFYAISDDMGTTTMTGARASLIQQTYTRSGDVLTTKAVDWTKNRGWYMDLTSGEQMNTRPAMAYGAVTFVTNKAGATDCSASSWFYVIDVATATKSATAGYVSTQISATANASAATIVTTTSGSNGGGGGGGGGGGDGGGTGSTGCTPQLKALMQTTGGTAVTQNAGCGGKVDPSKNTWREVRRK